MKINRTFSIPVSTAMKLKTVRNQSALVGRAIEKYLRDQEQFALGDVPINELMMKLHSLTDDKVLKALLESKFTANKKVDNQVNDQGSRPKPPYRSLT